MFTFYGKPLDLKAKKTHFDTPAPAPNKNNYKLFMYLFITLQGTQKCLSASKIFKLFKICVCNKHFFLWIWFFSPNEADLNNCHDKMMTPSRVWIHFRFELSTVFVFFFRTWKNITAVQGYHIEVLRRGYRLKKKTWETFLIPTWKDIDLDRKIPPSSHRLLNWHMPMRTDNLTIIASLPEVSAFCSWLYLPIRCAKSKLRPWALEIF